MRFLGSKYVNNAFAPDLTALPQTPLLVKREGPPGWAPPPRKGEGEEQKGRGGEEGANCCHQMSDFAAKMRGRAI